MKSPRAFARYRTLVQEANSSPVMLRRDLYFTEAELTWDHLTELEADTFLIEPALLNALVIAQVRYSDMTGQTDLDFSEFRDEERAAFPEFFHCENQFSIDAAAGFMATACKLPFTQTLMWACRAQVQLVRSGLLSGDEDAPPWSYAKIGQPACI